MGWNFCVPEVLKILIPFVDRLVQKALVCIGFLALTAAASHVAAQTSPPSFSSSSLVRTPLLTNAAQVLALSPEVLKANPKVSIQGMVTFYNSSLGLFVQDETAGIFVYQTSGVLTTRAGDYVTVNGFANQGLYSSIIDSPHVTAIPSGPPVSPRQVSLAEIYMGGLDSQLVEVTGVVRAQKSVADDLRLELAIPPHRLPVWIPHCGPGAPPQFQGCVVKIRGVVGTQYIDYGKLVGFQIFANSVNDITVIRSVTEGPEPPIILAKEVQNPRVRTDGVGRVRVAGVVTLHWPGRALFIQDSSGGIELQADHRSDPLTSGTMVEATGFLAAALDAPKLEDSSVREVHGVEPIRPLPISIKDLLEGKHSQELVQLEANLLDLVNSTSNSVVLALQSGGHLLNAFLDKSKKESLLSEFEAGSLVRVTGVCQSSRGESGAPPSVCLLLRSAQDLAIIAPAPARGALALVLSNIATALAAISLIGALWYGQRQRKQTLHVLEVQANLRAEMRQGEQQLRRAMEERDRIGRDLHDDIIQSIYAVGLNLEDCRRVVREAPQQIEPRLVSAIGTLNNTIRGVRGFLSGLESKVLNGREFRTALKSLALTSGDEPTPFHIEVDASAANSLTSIEATQLLHIAKEAMSNSLRHAQASKVTVALHHVTQGVQLEIRDNGTGFKIEATSGTGHGLRNMTARAREIGADLQIISAPGQGCRIIATLTQRKLNEHS